MTERQTRILSIDGTQLTIGVDEAAACSGCRSKTVCGSGDGTVHRIEVPADLAGRLRPGDSVSLQIDDGVPMRAALLAYLLPLTGLLAGIAAGSLAGLPDAAVLLCGCSGLTSGALLTRTLAGHWRRALQPQVCADGPRTSSTPDT